MEYGIQPLCHKGYESVDSLACTKTGSYPKPTQTLIFKAPLNFIEAARRQL